jgi:WD40 repeat protein
MARAVAPEFLSSRAAATNQPVSDAPPPPIPDFTMYRPIGRGAYGEVWLARSVTGVHRAVKIVRRDSFGDERPFEREFAGLKRFEPISVGQESQVGLLHVGRNEAEGFFYYVMELADDVETGEEIFPERYVPKTLTELRVRQYRLSVSECLDIGLALTRALTHLHANGLVHRDIKPSNVIFVHGVPKLADIGLVSTIDTSHSFVGTEGFVPPEGPGTAAADIFSLGKVLYEISTGRDRNDFPNLPEELEKMPDRRALLELNEIILKACDRDVKRRYSSAAAMREDLLLVQAGRSVRQLHLTERRLRFIAKYGVAATFISALAIAGFLWASAQTGAVRRNLERAERAERTALNRLHDANLNWVRANRLTGRPGQRHDSIAELAKAATRTNSLDLRNEAIACLMLPDVRPLKSWAKTPLWESFNFSADFQIYGTNDPLGNLFIRDTASDDLRYTLSTKGAPLTGAASSADSRFVATSDMNGKAWLWTLGTQMARPIPFAADSRLLNFTPDGRALVVKSADGALRFINTTSGLEEETLEGFGKLRNLQFNSSGDLFLFSDQEKVHIHRRRDGFRTRTLAMTAGVQAVAWHPNGRTLAIAWSKYIGLWSTETGQQRGFFTGHENTVVGLAFNDTGDWLASASWDRTTRLWQTDTAREMLSLNGSGNHLRLSRDGRRLAFTSWDNAQVHLHELADQRLTRRFTMPKSSFVASAAFSPNGNWLAIAADAAVTICSPTNPASLVELPVAGSGVAEFSADSQTVLTGGEGGLQRWPLQFDKAPGSLRVGSPEFIEVTSGHPIRNFRSSKAGRLMVVQPSAGPFLSIDSARLAQVIPTEAAVSPGHLNSVNGDGSLATSWSERKPNRLQIWNPQMGQLVTNLIETALLCDAVFSPDNRWLAVSTSETTSLRSTTDWQPRHRLGHPSTEGRHKLAFSPDGRTLASAVSDRELWLIDTETGAPLAAIPADRMLSSMTYDPTGETLVATYEAGYFQIWNLGLLRAQLARMNLDWPAPVEIKSAKRL